MEQKIHGGNRKGAGAKKKSVLDKRQPVTVYPLGKDILKFGDIEKMKEKLMDFIENYEDESKINYHPVTKDSFEGKKNYLVRADEPAKFLQPEKKNIAIKRNTLQWVELRRACENSEDFEKWLDDLENDTFLSKREKDQIKVTV